MEIVQVCAFVMQQFGISRGVGQIFGVIYSSPRPLAFSDVVESVDLSKGSVSQGLRFLRDLGAIKLVEVPMDRREHFVAETQLRKLIGHVLRTRLSEPLESSLKRIKAIERQLERDDVADREFLAKRLDSLQTWHRKALFFLPLIQKFIGTKG